MHAVFTSLQTHLLYASLAPWFALSLLLTGRNPHPSRCRIIVSILMATGILMLSIKHFSVARWVTLLEPNPSITLTALLAIALIARVGGPRLFRPQDWTAAWVFGAIVSLILYPTALGLTAMDFYSWGWGNYPALATASIATVLLLTNSRFGIVLVLALLGMVLHPLESRNDWDCLITPCYGIFSLLAVITLFIRYKISTGHSGSARRKALP